MRAALHGISWLVICADGYTQILPARPPSESADEEPWATQHSFCHLEHRVIYADTRRTLFQCMTHVLPFGNWCWCTHRLGLRINSSCRLAWEEYLGLLFGAVSVGSISG